MKFAPKHFDLTPSQIEDIELLESLGWKFGEDEWQDGHNHNNYYDLEFKSPRMKEFWKIDDKKLNLKNLCMREAENLSFYYIRNNEDRILDKYMEMAKEKFLEDKNLKIEQLKLEI